MASIRINLLPHREQKRQARQRQFYTLMISLAVLGLAVIALVHGILAAKIENQESRNKVLKTEIAKLDEQIKEIDRLRDQIAAVLARKQVVETLQGNRSEAVHLLDQLVRQLPDGIYIRNVKQVGAKVTIIGYAQSNARVSTLMRNIEASPWLSNPELGQIRLVSMPGAKDPNQKVNEFTLAFLIKRAAPIEAEAIGVAGKPGVPVKAPAAPAKPAVPAEAKKS
jgi:type IV pilus assembly protein PilN